MKHIIHTFDGITDKTIQREMTSAEVTELLAYQAQAQEKKSNREAVSADIKATKIAAYQKMGLTQKEIDALMPPDPEPLP